MLGSPVRVARPDRWWIVKIGGVFRTTDTMNSDN